MLSRLFSALVLAAPMLTACSADTGAEPADLELTGATESALDTRVWSHLSPVPGHPFADVNTDLGLATPTRFGAKFAVPGDFDGDGRLELAVAPDITGTAGNDLWVMKFDPAARSWSHMSQIPGHSFGADMNLDEGVAAPTRFGVKFAVPGDFDGDGRTDLAIAPDIGGTAGNDLWVMKFDTATRRWVHMSRIPGHGFAADLNCDEGVDRPTSFGVKFAVPGDFDGDGRTDLAIAPDIGGTAGNDLWVMKFDTAARRWVHMSRIPGHDFAADLNCDDGVARPTSFGVKLAVAADFDGDRRSELVVVPDLAGTGGNDLWVMKFDPAARRWNHMSPIAGHPFSADLNCDEGASTPAAFGVKTAVAGDFDGDGRAELAVAPDVAGTAGNDMWVMKFDTRTRRWGHMSPIAGHPFAADLNADDIAGRTPTPFGVRSLAVGDFMNNRRDRIAIVPETTGNSLWMMEFDRAARRWVHTTSGGRHPFRADLSLGDAFNTKFVAVGDFNGNGGDEVVVAPDLTGTAGNDFAVMTLTDPPPPPPDPDAPAWRFAFEYAGAPPFSQLTLRSPSGQDFKWRVIAVSIPPYLEGQSSGGEAKIALGWTGAYCRVEVFTNPSNFVQDIFDGFPE